MRQRSIATAGRAALFICAAMFAACSDTTSPVMPSLSSSATVTTSATATTTVPAVTVGGATENATLPIASSAVSLTETVSTTPPSGVNALQSVSGFNAAYQRHAASSSFTDTTLFYLQYTTSASVALDGTPAITFTLASIAAGAVYYLALYDDAAGTWTAPFPSAGIVNGDAVSFPATATVTNVSSYAPLSYALYSSVTTVSASPSPSPSPTATPTPAPSAAPATLTFEAASPSPQPINVTEAGAAGTFPAGMTCTDNGGGLNFVAEFVNGLTATTATAAAPSGQFIVQNGTDAGVCTITIADARGAQTSVTIDNDAFALGASSIHRK